MYRGLSFPFKKGPSGYPEMLEDEDLIWNDVKALFNTNQRSRVMRPKFGMNLESLVFENTGPLLRTKIYTAIVNALNNFEPRVQLIDLQISETRTEVQIDSLIRVLGVEKKVRKVINRGEAR